MGYLYLSYHCKDKLMSASVCVCFVVAGELWPSATDWSVPGLQLRSVESSTGCPDVADLRAAGPAGRPELGLLQQWPVSEVTCMNGCLLMWVAHDSLTERPLWTYIQDDHLSGKAAVPGNCLGDNSFAQIVHCFLQVWGYISI